MNDRMVLFFSFGAALALLAGCATRPRIQEEHIAADNARKTETSRPRQPEPSENGTIDIVAAFGKTGSGSFASIANFRGVELAVEQLNRQGGVLNRKINLIELDTRGDHEGGREAALEAISQNATAVIGARASSASLAMAPILQKAGMPMITPSSTHPDVTKVGNYIFRVCYTDTFQGGMMAYYAFVKLGVRSAAVMTNINSDYSRELSTAFEQAFARLGGKIVFRGQYTAVTENFGPELKRLKELNPGAVFLPDYSEKAAFLINQIGQTGYKGLFLGGDGWNAEMTKLTADKALLDRCWFSSHWHPALKSEVGARFVKYYKEKYGEEPEVANAALSYDAVMVLALAIRHARSLDRVKIQKALSLIRDYQCVTGSIKFNTDGDPVEKNAVILKFENGKVKLVSEAWKRKEIDGNTLFKTLNGLGTK